MDPRFPLGTRLLRVHGRSSGRANTAALIVLVAGVVFYSTRDRGPVVGALAAATYLYVFRLALLPRSLGAARPTRPRPPESLLLIPLAFVLIAIVTPWPLTVCVATAMTAWLVLVAVKALRRRSG